MKKSNMYYAALLFSLALLLVGCGTPGPRELELVKRDVDSRLTYQQYSFPVSATHIAQGKAILHIDKPAKTSGPANCTEYALAYREALGRGTLMGCIVPNQGWHAYLLVDGWVLDNREWYVVKEGENCK